MGASASIGTLEDISSEDICEMLASIGLPQYSDYIRENEINGSVLARFQDKAELVSYLNDIGIDDESNQEKISSTLIQLKERFGQEAFCNVDQTDMSPPSPINMHSAFLSAEALSAELASDATNERLEEMGTIDGFGDGFTPLMAATYFGNTDVVFLLLDLGADVNAKSTNEQNTPLMFAAVSGNTEITSILLDREAEIDARNNDGWTALMFACSNQFLQVAKMLIESGASTDVKDKSGSDAMSLIIEDADKESFQVILDSRGN